MKDWAGEDDVVMLDEQSILTISFLAVSRMAGPGHQACKGRYGDMALIALLVLVFPMWVALTDKHT